MAHFSCLTEPTAGFPSTSHLASQNRNSELGKRAWEGSPWPTAIDETLGVDQHQLLDGFGKLMREIDRDCPPERSPHENHRSPAHGLFPEFQQMRSFCLWIVGKTTTPCIHEARNWPPGATGARIYTPRCCVRKSDSLKGGDGSCVRIGQHSDRQKMSALREQSTAVGKALTFRITLLSFYGPRHGS